MSVAQLAKWHGCHAMIWHHLLDGNTETCNVSCQTVDVHVEQVIFIQGYQVSADVEYCGHDTDAQIHDNKEKEHIWSTPQWFQKLPTEDDDSNISQHMPEMQFHKTVHEETVNTGVWGHHIARSDSHERNS